MKTYLLLYTIGPVQSFIAQARKTQDLWGGSALLSELSRQTALYAEKAYTAKIIFPDVHAGKSSMPNRFLALVTTENMQKVGNSLQTYTQGLLKDKGKLVLKDMSKFAEFVDKFEQQLNGFLQIHWVALPCEENEYAEKFHKIEQLLAAVKNVRTFKPLHENPARKCTLSGERNALFYDEHDRPDRFITDAVSVGKYKLTKGEGLDAIGYLKRAGDPKQFPSTAKIALSDTLARFEPKVLLSSFKSCFSHFDEQLYFEENLRDEYLVKHAIDGNLLTAKKFWDDIYSHAKDKNLVFQKYYAVIMLDGDSVGAWLSGSKLANSGNKISKTNLLEYHKHVTQELNRYADFVEKLFSDEKKGALVYCGGDDVLAFVNLVHLVEVLKTLREKIPDFDGTRRFTASAGAVIAHYKIPLSEVLKWVRKIEKEAKKIDHEKDKLALAVLKHSGEIEKSVFIWNLPNGSANLDVLQNLLEIWRDELVSSSFVRNLQPIFAKLLDEQSDIFHYKNLMATELERAITRAITKKGESPSENVKIQGLIVMLKALLENNRSLQDFLSFLSIAEFIDRKVRSWS